MNCHLRDCRLLVACCFRSLRRRSRERAPVYNSPLIEDRVPNTNVDQAFAGCIVAHRRMRRQGADHEFPIHPPACSQRPEIVRARRESKGLTREVVHYFNRSIEFIREIVRIRYGIYPPRPPACFIVFLLGLQTTSSEEPGRARKSPSSAWLNLQTLKDVSNRARSGGTEI